MAGRRAFGEIERRVGKSGTVSYRARYALPDGTRFSRTFATKLNADAWLSAERSLLDKGTWTTPEARRLAQDQQAMAASLNTVGRFAERYLRERSLRPTTRLPETAGQPHPARLRRRAPARGATNRHHDLAGGPAARHRVIERGRVPIAALDPPGGRARGALRPGAPEGAWRVDSSRQDEGATGELGRAPSDRGPHGAAEALRHPPRSSACARASFSSCAAATSTWKRD
jgi:hypothetical protein